MLVGPIVADIAYGQHNWVVLVVSLGLLSASVAVPIVRPSIWISQATASCINVTDNLAIIQTEVGEAKGEKCHSCVTMYLGCQRRRLIVSSSALRIIHL